MANLEIIFIIALIILQIVVFIIVFRKVKCFKNFFPDSLAIKVVKKILNEEGDSVELLQAPEKDKDFGEIIHSTNDYLLKNKGAAADFGILKDISERHLEKFDNEIGNLINVPLYIGLGGTFMGIIIGLFGISFADVSSEGAATISQQSISQLLNGVITAMFASLAGLIFTVINSVYYKSAAYKNDTDKNNYYDLLQRELLPALNTGVAKSLGNLNVVLNQFLAKFGDNMDDYRDSGRLLNENLSKQQFVLEEINKLSLTRTATKISETFLQLKDISDELDKFQSYQKGLNTYIDKTEHIAQEMKSIIGDFKDFSINLKAITNKTQDSIELQKQFKDSLETHFPTISDHREIWRSQIDELNQDVKKVYQELYNYFKEETEQVKTYMENYHGLLSGIDDIKNAVQIFVENSNAQKQEFEHLQKTITDLRNDFKESQRQNIETNMKLIEAIIEIKKDTQAETVEASKALIKAIKSLNQTIDRIAKPEKKEN